MLIKWEKANARAFSLLEMALVLVIMGVILSGGITLFNIFYKKSKLAQAEEFLNSSYESLITLASSKLCLEVPTNFAEQAANILPPLIQQRQDPFLKYIRYFYAPELAPPTCRTNDTVNNICGRRRTSFAIEICKDESCATKDVVNNVVFVLVSGGWNKNIQIDNNIQIQVQEDTNNDGTFENINKNGIRIHFPYANGKDGYSHATSPYNDPNTPGEFDDIFRYLTLEQLQAKIQCENAKLRITTDNLPPAYQNMAYSANIYGDGGVPYQSGGRYKWTYTHTLPPEFSISLTTDNRGDSLSDNRGDSLSISKVANASACPGTYTLNITALEDSDGNRVSKTFSLSVLPDQLKVNPDRLTLNPIVGRAFSHSVTLNLSGGKLPWTCSPTGSTSYNGLNFTFDDSTKTATISGIPTDAGSTTFKVSCNDSCTGSARQTVESLLTVMITCDQLKVLPDRGVWNATVGSPVNINVPLSISGGKSPYNCSVSGSNTCNGLTFSCNSTQATISGTPTAAGNCNFTCSCTDSCSGSAQTVSSVYSVAISATSAGGGGGSGATCSFNYTPPSAGSPASVSISITGGPTNVSFSPITGTCTNFTNVNSVNCTTAPLNANLHITAQLSSGNSCSPTTQGKICVMRQSYRVWNNAGVARDFRTPKGTCRRVSNNAEITQTQNNDILTPGTTVRAYSTNNGSCGGQELGYIDYSWAACTDDNGNRQIYFSGDSSSDR